MKIVALNTGATMPLLGLGVYQAKPGEECRQAVLWALQAGYRHIDTARAYSNERDVGSAVADSGVPRAEIFVTTKLRNADQGYDAALRAFDSSMADLAMDYVDLYLVHWPLPEKRLDSWRALEKIHASDRAKAIGVSNYLERHLDELFEHSSIVPAVNQVECSPFLQMKSLHEYCRGKGIQFEAYSPLTQGQKLNHETLLAIANACGRTPAQVILRWAIQHGIAVIPKSVRRERIVENAAIFDFELDPEQMASLDALDENFRTCWDPTTVD